MPFLKRIFCTFGVLVFAQNAGAKDFMYFCQPETVYTKVGSNPDIKKDKASKDISFFIGSKFAVKCNKSRPDPDSCHAFPLLFELEGIHLVYLDDHGVAIHTHHVAIGFDGSFTQYSVVNNAVIEQRFTGTCSRWIQNYLKNRLVKCCHYCGQFYSFVIDCCRVSISPHLC